MAHIPRQKRRSNQESVSGGFATETFLWLINNANQEYRCWLRQLPADHIYMQEEILGIDTAVELQRSSVGLGFWEPFRALANNRRVLYRFILGGLLFLFQNASGINAISEHILQASALSCC
jgi:hypothetical protein